VDITAWLHSLGMQQYEAAFRENAIDAAVLPELTTGDLKDLGVTLVGHRRKLLAAIAALGSEGGSEPPIAPVGGSPVPNPSPLGPTLPSPACGGGSGSGRGREGWGWLPNAGS
jgi:hypothetical protein